MTESLPAGYTPKRQKGIIESPRPPRGGLSAIESLLSPSVIVGLLKEQGKKLDAIDKKLCALLAQPHSYSSVIGKM